VANRETIGVPELPAATNRSSARRASPIDKVIFLASVVPLVRILFGWRLHGVTVTFQLALPWILAGVVACCPQLFSLKIIRLGGFPENDEFGLVAAIRCPPLRVSGGPLAIRGPHTGGSGRFFRVPRGDRHASELSVHDFDRLAAQLGERITAIEIKAD
jgi:hypothetical protein